MTTIANTGRPASGGSTLVAKPDAISEAPPAAPSKEARTSEGRDNPATRVTLSAREVLKLDHGEEVRRDPINAITMFRRAFIEMDKAHLAWLESGAEVINLIDGKPITAEMRERSKASTRAAIAENEAVLKEHLLLASGIDPVRRRAEAEKAAVRPPALEEAPAALPIAVAPVAPLQPKAKIAVAAQRPDATILELLIKSAEAYGGKPRKA